MARFVVDQPITTREPAIEVDAGLEPGVHGFSLVVVDAAGKASRADTVVVRVRRLVGPDDSPGPVRPSIDLPPPFGPPIPILPSMPPLPPPAPLRPTQLDPHAPHRRSPQEPKP